MPSQADLAIRRIDRFLTERLLAATYAVRHTLSAEAWTAPGVPVSFDHAIGQATVPVAVGEAWGAPWRTTWFHLTGPAPDPTAGPAKIVVDLGFTDVNPGFQAEGLYWSADGRPLKGLNPRNRALTWPARVPVDVWVEAAANPSVMGRVPESFDPTGLGSWGTAGDEPAYIFRGAELVHIDIKAYELWQDAAALRGLLDVLPSDSARFAELLATLGRMADTVDPDDVAGTAAAGRKVLAAALELPANASAHTAYAVGHAHIDSAWLWPARETVRKCARTFSNVLAQMDDDPDLVFACSSAQQYAWVKEAYPELFERIRARVAEGRWIPVGGMWVESDTNMPGGEAMVRQFLTGKAFFLREFGLDTRDVWLPDSFGYSGALPQIAVAAGNRWMLTQKLGWNETNQMPHHTFHWEGIDGTRILIHFPPVDTYNGELTAAELDHAARNNRDKDAINASIVPFGHGDGGGGPTADMLARAKRYANTEGSARVQIRSPYDFFEAAEQAVIDPAVWSGEMYLEYHRGTYTSQARTKQGNRRSEHLLREAELWAATASVLHDAPYPYEEFDAAWKRVLLNQFHDILPGSSIAWVYQDAEAAYAEVRDALERLIASSFAVLAGDGHRPLLFNAAPHSRRGVLALGAATPIDASQPEVTMTQSDSGDRVMANALISARISSSGHLVSLRDIRADRELIPTGTRANLLQIHRDTPRQWDAWDIDREYLHVHTDVDRATSISTVSASAHEAVVEINWRFGTSTVRQRLTLESGSAALRIDSRVDWHERQKLLKLAFPFDVHADRSAAETQFGHVFRPTHANTGWDAAKFETCAHRWVHIAEPGYGVAVANSATYGHDIRRSLAPSGRSMTTIRESLLRAPTFPDPDADQGVHDLTTVVHIGADLADAIRDGYATNLEPRMVMGSGRVDPLITHDNEAVIVEAVKLAEDRSGDLVVRLYESLGSHARTRLRLGFVGGDVRRTDLLERPLEIDGAGPEVDLELPIALRPFEIVTLRIQRG